MDKEIRRSDWSRFLKRFSRDNRYRPIEASSPNWESAKLKQERLSLMGLCLRKKGRYIDGIQVHACKPDTVELTAPIIDIPQPTRIVVAGDRNGGDVTLTVESSDGSQSILRTVGYAPDDPRGQIVERLAYTFFESRGRAHNGDKDDWYAAEEHVRAIEEAFV